MSTGRRAFEGKSQASLIGAIMHAEPLPVSSVAPLSPPQFDRLVTACLAKDAADRVQSAHDVKLQLEWIAAGDSSVSAPATRGGKTSASWMRVAAVAVVAIVVTAAVTAFLLRGNTASPPELQRYILGSAALSSSSVPTLSPDGRYVVLCVEDGNSSHLFRRDLT
jgi:hypothetical protein